MKETAAPTRRQGAYLTAGRDKSPGSIRDVRFVFGARMSKLICALRLKLRHRKIARPRLDAGPDDCLE